MYIDAKLIRNRIYVSYKDKDNITNVKEYMPPYVFYYVDESGQYTSIYGDKLNKKLYYNKKEFLNSLENHINRGKYIFESDVNPVYRLLEEKYPENDCPKLNISFIDIEVDKDSQRGWASSNNPYAQITAITLYNTWEQKYYTIALAPPTLSNNNARALLDDPSTEFGALTEDNGYYICDTEEELLVIFLDLIQDADIITGYNSTYFDLPYIIQRIRIVLGKEDMLKIIQEDGSKEHPMSPSEESVKYLLMLGRFPDLPNLRKVERFGGLERVYDISGRVHLDYLELYTKFTFEELHSYSLDSVLQKEIKQSKIAYLGTLEELYRNDFKRFIAYNRQDVAGLVALDTKKKLIDLANSMVHMAGVTFDKVFGSVVIIEQAILKKLHKNGFICFNKEEKSDSIPVPGAFVADPEAGLFDWIVTYDVTSLYPSVIRTLNISSEVIIGQFKLDKTEQEYQKYYIKEKEDSAKAWSYFTGVLEYHDIIEERNNLLTLVIEGSKEEITAPANEWKQILLEHNWCVSANGTVFDMNKEGIITQCISEWFEDRILFKTKQQQTAKMQEGVTDPVKLAELKDLESYYDTWQQVKKIFLNSTYGGMLNEYFRFHDPRMGRSITLSGRCIVKHMGKETTRIISGEYLYNPKYIQYGDTDSVFVKIEDYMNQKNIPITPPNVIKVADELGDQINKSFPKFMHESFLISPERGKMLKAGRDVVATRGLFKNKKKRYALHVINKEGKNTDSMKIMGMETRRSDTPKFIQSFLEKCLTLVVKEGIKYEELYKLVDEFRNEVFRKTEPWKQGSPSRVSNLTTNSAKLEQYDNEINKGRIDIKKPLTHYSVNAANNTNKLIKLFHENRWDTIKDGDKIEILYLLDNSFNMSVIANKVGDVYTPDWFKQLPFDKERHEEKLINQKLDNVIGSILKWDFSPKKDYSKEVFKDDDFFS